MATRCTEKKSKRNKGQRFVTGSPLHTGCSDKLARSSLFLAECISTELKIGTVLVHNQCLVRPMAGLFSSPFPWWRLCHWLSYLMISSVFHALSLCSSNHLPRTICLPWHADMNIPVCLAVLSFLVINEITFYFIYIL